MNGYRREGDYLTNGVIAVLVDDPKVRKGCAKGNAACHEKGPYRGPGLMCRVGLHQWELNFRRQSVDHWHCLDCGKGSDH